MEKNKKVRNYSLDFLKLIASYFVIIIHCSSNVPYSNYFLIAARFAVPVFFIISGYYSFKAIENRNFNKIKQRIISLLKLYIWSEALFILSSVISDSINGITLSEWTGSILNLKNIFYFIFFNNNLPFGGLWFITALIYVYLISMVVMKLNKPKLFTFFAFIIIFTLIAQLFIPLTPNCYIRNAYTIGLPFFSIGFLLKKHENKVNKIKIPIAAGIIIFGLLLSLAEAFTLKSIFGKTNYEIFIGSTVMAIFSVIMALKFKFNKKGFFIENLGKATTYIYIFHTLISTAIHIALNFINIDSPVLTLILTIPASTAFSYILIFIKLIITKKYKKIKASA